MSVAVGLDNLRDEITRYGRAAFLLTVTDDARPHAVAVAPRWDGDALVVAAGSTTSANAAARTDVTLLWPPLEEGGYSLIVDGAASIPADGSVAVRPTKAVLHRPAADDPHGSDCVRVYKA